MEDQGLKYLGLGIETDESQPFHNRWTGYRFQVTIMTACFVHSHSEWEQARWDRSPPIRATPLLSDICHAPTKVQSERRKALFLYCPKSGHPFLGGICLFSVVRFSWAGGLRQRGMRYTQEESYASGVTRSGW